VICRPVYYLRVIIKGHRRLYKFAAMIGKILSVVLVSEFDLQLFREQRSSLRNFVMMFCLFYDWRRANIFVEQTSELRERIEKYFTDEKKWTKKFHPVAIHRIFMGCQADDDLKFTISCMEKYLEWMYCSRSAFHIRFTFQERQRKSCKVNPCKERNLFAL
jgi:hypothetical protein